jgi:predicted nucleic acid-binding protein
MIALDSNLLIYAHRGVMPEHTASRRAIEQAVAAPQGWGIPLPCLAEFWNVVTHPRVTGHRSTTAAAQQFIVNLIEGGGGNLWQPGPDFGRRLVQLAVEMNITNGRVFDLQIALIAFENGATELWSHDRNFVGAPAYECWIRWQLPHSPPRLRSLRFLLFQYPKVYLRV